MTLHALLVAMSAILGAHTADTPRILSAIESATTDTREAALLVTYAWRESRFQEHPRAWSWDSRAGLASGAWQLHGPMGHASLEQQARAWLYLLHEGARVCPEAPLAPLSGGCVAARRVAEVREREATRLLAGAMEKQP